jgi:UrcA family protein
VRAAIFELFVFAKSKRLVTFVPDHWDVWLSTQPMQPFVHLRCAIEIATSAMNTSGALAMSSHTGSSRRVTRFVAAIVATVVGIPASFAQAAEVAGNDSDARAITVSHSDLNLATAEGSHTLYLRLVDAARRVCPPIGRATELRTNLIAQRCISASVENAVKQVRSVQFAQVAASKMR